MPRGYLNALKTYSFKDKDPVIDCMRTLVEIQAALQNITFYAELHNVSDGTGISMSCLHAWFSGPTMSPRHSYVAAVLNYYERPLMVGGLPIDKHWAGSYKARNKPRFSVVRSKRAAG